MYVCISLPLNIQKILIKITKYTWYKLLPNIHTYIKKKSQQQTNQYNLLLFQSQFPSPSQAPVKPSLYEKYDSASGYSAICGIFSGPYVRGRRNFMLFTGRSIEYTTGGLTPRQAILFQNPRLILCRLRILICCHLRIHL